MANFRYFTTCGGQTVQLKNVYHSGRVSTKPDDFSGTRPVCSAIHQAERKIERPGTVSNHKCDARCEGATGHRCECSCGGKNHGIAA